MILTWDPPKRLANLDVHHLDLANLTVDFFLNALVLPAKKGRFKAIGKFRGLTVVVVFKPLGREAVSLISMRRASKKERKLIDG